MGFPQTIVTFPTKQNMEATDGQKVANYQAAMEAQDLASAQAILQTISNYQDKIFDAEYFNLITKTLAEVEAFYMAKFSPAYIVSASQPVLQEPTDFWFQVTDTE